MKQTYFVVRYQMPFCHLCGLSVVLLASSKLPYGVCSMNCLFPFLWCFPELAYLGWNGQAQDQREVPLLCSLQMWCLQPMRVSFPLKNLIVANSWTIENYYFLCNSYFVLFLPINKPFRGHFFLPSLSCVTQQERQNLRVNGMFTKTFNFSKFSREDYKLL